MEVRDLKAYRQLIYINNNSENENTTIGTADDLLTSLDGVGVRLESRINGMTSFAGRPHEQIFYELLQNAHDAHSDSFHVRFDETGIFFINNGKAFTTEKPRMQKGELLAGELIGLLQNNKSPKYGNDEAIGQFGIGFKLIYNLLGGNILDKILNDLQGPIIFSWSKLSHLEVFLRENGNNFEVQPGYVGTELPLLTKIVCTYYPANMGEKRRVLDNEEESELFSHIELMKFREAFKSLFERENISVFAQGTAVYLPISNEVFEKLNEAVSGDMKGNLQISRNLVPSIEHISINGERINKEEVTVINLGNENRISQDAVLFLDDKPTTNFFNFFPAFNENYGFNFIVHSYAFKLPPDRQKIDWSRTENEEVLNRIADNLKRELGDRIIKDFEEYVKIFKSIIDREETDNFKNSTTVSGFYNKIIEFLKENVPTDKNTVRPANEVFINTSNTKIEFSDFNFNADWIHPELGQDEDRLEQTLSLGVSELNIAVLLAIERKEYSDWIKKMNAEEYRQLVIDVKESEYSEKSKLKYIKTIKGTILSQEELKSADCQIIPLTSTLQSLKPVFDRHTIEYTDPAFLEGCEELISIGTNVNLALFQRLLSVIHNTPNLLPDEKWDVFRVMRDHLNLNPDKIREEVGFFKNVNGVEYYIRFLLPDHLAIAPSGILRDFQIDPNDKNDELLKNYYFKKEDVWGLISMEKKWNEYILGKLNVGNYSQVILDLTSIYSVRKIQYVDYFNERDLRLNQGIPWVPADDGTFNTHGSMIYYEPLGGLEQEEYDIITNFIKWNTSLKKIEYKFYEAVTNVTFALWGYQKFYNLPNVFLDNSVNISFQELGLLNRLTDGHSFFSHFYISQEDGGAYRLTRHNGIIKQYSSNDTALNSLLSTNPIYKQLPQELFAIFQDDGQLRKDTDPNFISELIQNFSNNNFPIGSPAALGLVGVVSRSTDNVKQLFLYRLGRLDVQSTVQYNRDSFESHVIKMALFIRYDSVLKNKTFIDSHLLSDIQYNDDFSVVYENRPLTFRVSDLIEFDVPDLRGIAINFDAHVRSFFSTEDYPIDQLVEEVQQYTYSNNAQLGFLITQDIFPSENELSRIDRRELFDYFFNNELNKINKIFTSFNDWIVTDNGDYLLEEEKAEAWLTNWWGNDEAKKKWLKKNGLRFDDCAAMYFRKNLGNELLDNLIKQSVKAKEKPDDTIRWMESANINWNDDKVVKNIDKFIEAYIGENEKLPDYLPVTDWSDNVKSFVSLEDLDNVSLFCVENYYENYRRILYEIFDNNGYEFGYYYDLKNFTQDNARRKISKISSEISLRESIFEDELDIRSVEWSEDFYNKWKQEDAQNWSIYLTQEAINRRLFVKIDNEIFTEDIQSGECEYRFIEPENTHEIFVHGSDHKEIMELLEKHHQRVFKSNKDKFVSLQRHYIEFLQEDERMELVRDIPVEDLKNLIAGNRGNGGGNLNAPGWTDVQIDRFNKLKDKLARLLNDEFAEDKLDALLNTPTINELSGYIGERVAYHWLHNQYKDQVSHDNQPAYDLSLSVGEKQYFLEVKTTVDSLINNGNPIPVYLRKSQQQFLETQPNARFILLMLSIKDLGIEHVYRDYRGLNLEVIKDELDRRIAQWIADNCQRIPETEIHFSLAMPLRQDDPLIF